MSKQALGSIPTFDSVSVKGEPLDLFTEESKSTEDDLKAKLKEEIIKGKEDFKKKTKDKEITKQLKEMKKQEETLKQMQEEIEKEKEQPLASVKRDVRKGYIRQTFVIKEEYLEIIRAISFYQNIKQVNFLEALIEAGLKEIDEKVIEQAVKEYRKNNAIVKTKAEEEKLEQIKVSKLFKERN